MLTSAASLLLATMLMVGAQSIPSNELTLTFTPDGHSCATPSNASDLGLSFHLDLDQFPKDSLCLNLKDIFSNRSSTQTGTADNSAAVNASLVNPHGQTVIPTSVNWTSYGGDQYNPTGNYTNVWYLQQNVIGKVGEGQLAQLLVRVWPYDNCLWDQNHTGFGYSCQTGLEGQCNEVYDGVKSLSFYPQNQSADSCFQFQKFPSSGSSTYGRAGLYAGIVVVLAGMVLFM